MYCGYSIFKNRTLSWGLQAGGQGLKESGEVIEEMNPSQEGMAFRFLYFTRPRAGVSLTCSQCVIPGRIFLAMWFVVGTGETEFEPLSPRGHRLQVSYLKQICNSWPSPRPLISHIPECHNEKQKRKQHLRDLAIVQRKNGKSLFRLMPMRWNLKFLWSIKEQVMSNG